MNAKEYLGQAYRLDQEINAKLEQVGRLRALAEKVTVSYEGEAVCRTRNVTSLQDTIVRILEAEQALNAQIDRLVDVKMEISDTISRVHNINYRLILEKRYLCFEDWDSIAAEMNYSRRSVEMKHKSAVAVVDRLLQEQAT